MDWEKARYFVKGQVSYWRAKETGATMKRLSFAALLLLAAVAFAGPPQPATETTATAVPLADFYTLGAWTNVPDPDTGVWHSVTPVYHVDLGTGHGPRRRLE
jgi:hypothetical protein